MKQLRSTKQAGVALTEFLLTSSFFTLLFFLIPALADVGISRMKAISGACLLAWDRTVFAPQEAFNASGEMAGIVGAMEKSDEEARRDVLRHVFRSRTANAAAIHDPRYAEFSVEAPPSYKGLVIQASTTTVDLPAPLKAIDAVADGFGTLQDGAYNNLWVRSLSGFRLVTGGFVKNKIEFDQPVPLLAKLLPQGGVQISEQLTLLIEPWNAGGTNREEQKIQGLVPAKVMDLPVYQQARSAFQTAAYQVNQINPTYNINNIHFGFRPGDASERTPLDRHQLREDLGSAKQNRGRFRYYRAFHLNGGLTSPVSELP